MGLHARVPGMPPDETAPTFDLQSHSTHSDGSLPPAEVVARAADAGVDAVRADRPRHRRRCARGARQRRVLSTSNSSRRWSSPRSTASTRTCTSSATGSTTPTATLLATLADFRPDRIRRILAMADNLRELGFTIDPAARSTRRPADRTWRPRCSHDNDLTLMSTENEALRPLPRPGHADLRRAFAARPSSEAIEVIHAAGGVAVWAHPYWDVEQAERHAARVRAPPRPRRRRGLLRHPHGGADPPSTRAGARARADHDRLDRLPRARTPALQSLPGVFPPRPEPHLGLLSG